MSQEAVSIIFVCENCHGYFEGHQGRVTYVSLDEERGKNEGWWCYECCTRAEIPITKELKQQILEDVEKEDEENSTWFTFSVSIKAHVNSNVKEVLYWMLHDKTRDTRASNRIYHVRSLRPNQVVDFKIQEEGENNNGE